MKKSVQFTFRKTSVDQFRDVLMDIRTRGLYSMIIDLKNENLPHFLTAVGLPNFSLPFLVLFWLPFLEVR